MGCGGSLLTACMAEVSLRIAGISVIVAEWEEIHAWGKNLTYLDWRAPWAPLSKVLKLPEAWLTAVNRHNQKVWASGENPWKLNTVEEARRQQRLNVFTKELVQHRKRVEQAQRQADLENELENMLLRGSLPWQ